MPFSRYIIYGQRLNDWRIITVFEFGLSVKGITGRFTELSSKFLLWEREAYKVNWVYWVFIKTHANDKVIHLLYDLRLCLKLVLASSTTQTNRCDRCLVTWLGRSVEEFAKERNDETALFQLTLEVVHRCLTLDYRSCYLFSQLLLDRVVVHGDKMRQVRERNGRWRFLHPCSVQALYQRHVCAVPNNNVMGLTPVQQSTASLDTIA